jgi:hypothetical protein
VTGEAAGGEFKCSGHLPMNPEAMSDTILRAGEKVFILHRQMFPGDTKRHFFGTVDACAGDLARVTGRVFTLDSRTNQFAPRDLARTRIISLAGDGVVVNVLPASVDIAQIRYTSAVGGQLHISDGSAWHMDINLN